jgi:hypothetical protein
MDSDLQRTYLPKPVRSYYLNTVAHLNLLCRQWNWRTCRVELDFVIVRLSLMQRYKLNIRFSLFTAGTMTGFDASGHIAEETKNARFVTFLNL